MKTSKKLSAGAVGTCLALILSGSATSFAASALHFERETLKAYEGQLIHHEVHVASFHPGTGASSGHIHVSLSDGRHMTIAYATSEQALLVAQAGAKGARVTIAVAKHKATKPVKHKLRYIAGGILIVVILIVLVVLLVGRRRNIMEEAQRASDGGGGEPPSGASTDAE